MAILKRTTLPLLIVIGVLLLALVVLFQNPGMKSIAQEITFTDFLTLEPHIRDIVIRGDVAEGHDDKNHAFTVTLPHDPAIATRLAEKHVSVLLEPAADQQSWLLLLLVNGLPLVVYLFLITWPVFRLARAIDAMTSRFPPRRAAT